MNYFLILTSCRQATLTFTEFLPSTSLSSIFKQASVVLLKKRTVPFCQAIVVRTRKLNYFDIR